MSFDTLPEKVRQCALVQALADKLSSPLPLPVSFDYWGEFKKLRDLVSAHMGEMKSLFPQLTQHNEEYHLIRLFGIADKMLGPERYAHMNVAELFLLACGLYAHDWGMAVGPDEVDYLQSGAKGAVIRDVFTPLDDEAERLREFVDKQGLRPANPGVLLELDVDHLRVYIRHTHAWRSGVRAREFFKSTGSSLPQALERVCQGHWLDFSEIDDERRFSAQFGVLGYTVNLRAIALYVRLVDLFDIADDRTPYAIWRFVSPRDPKAQIEWKKHRALSPITFPQYGDGRAVRFDGSTSDPEVWAELEDLRGYCENQLIGTNDLLARHRDERHQLDLRRIDWAVTAERFTPVNIRFEFNRQRMFEILADEIYQGDSHVFLRELLQNSIDAIRIRRELVQRRAASSGSRRDVGLGFDDAIYFTVEHGTDGDAVVHCRDFGIGMDEYVIRNYLAVAGVSYYQSDEFRHLGLKMDPISRFGIGILSCFMVAERIEIETYREPNFASDAKPLRIDIPAVERQFRVYAAPTVSDIGTIVKVHVRGAKLKSDVRCDKNNDTPPIAVRLKVTEYLAAIAGFVEFPIVVDEEGQRTVILHPDRSIEDAKTFACEKENIAIRQLTQNYPWEEMFLPQDVANAKKLLKPHVFDLRKDLGLENYEGTVSYLSPLGTVNGFSESYNQAQHIVTILFDSAHKQEDIKVRHHQRIQKMGVSLSSMRTPKVAIYRDGLLISDVSIPRRDTVSDNWPLPNIEINLPKGITGAPDVSRRTLRTGGETWDLPVWRALVHHLRDNDIAQALKLEPNERFKRLSVIVSIYSLTYNEIVNLIPCELWPSPVLTPEGKIMYSNTPFDQDQTFFNVPTVLEGPIACQLGFVNRFYKGIDFSALFALWRGDKIASVFSLDRHLRTFESVWMQHSSVRCYAKLVPINVRFLRAPLPGFPPLPQIEFISVEPSDLDATTLFERGVSEPLNLDASQRCALFRMRHLSHYSFRKLLYSVPFSEPFSNYFAWGDQILNIKHPITRALYRCVTALQWSRSTKTQSPAKLGLIEDILRDILENLEDVELIGDKLTKLWQLADECKLVEIKEQIKLPLKSDYVWGSLSDQHNYLFNDEDLLCDKWSDFQKFLRPFGDVLSDITPEEMPPDLEAVLR